MNFFQVTGRSRRKEAPSPSRSGRSAAVLGRSNMRIETRTIFSESARNLNVLAGVLPKSPNRKGQPQRGVIFVAPAYTKSDEPRQGRYRPVMAVEITPLTGLRRGSETRFYKDGPPPGLAYLAAGLGQPALASAATILNHFAL